MWSCFIFDTMTGLVQRSIDIPALSWRLTVSNCSLATTRDKGVGEDEGSGLRVPWSVLEADDSAQADRFLAPLRRGICLAWDGAPVVAGAIGSRTDTWEDTSFSLVSPFDLLKSRIAVVEGTFGTSEGHTTTSFHRWAGQSLRSIAAWLICNAVTKPGGQLPIDYAHYQNEPGGHERTYDGFNTRNNDINKLLTEITNVIGGPDMQFRPYLYDATHLHWRFIAGSDADPHIQANGLIPVLNCFPGGGSIQNLTVAHLAPTMRVYGTGAGEDKATLCHLAQDMTLCQRSDPWPLIESTAADSSGWDNYGLVQRHTESELAASKMPLIQIKGTVNVGDPACPIQPGTFWPGQQCYVDIDGFMSLPSGRYSLRVMEMSGDLSGSVDVVFDQIVDPWEGGRYAPL